VNFEETRDWPLIKRIVTNPKIYPFVSDDFSPVPEQWEPIDSAAAHYVLVRNRDELLGLWAFYEHTPICWQVHTCLLPIAYGERARRAAKEMAQWIWANTKCLRLITEVPERNRLALRFARAAGMTAYGFNPQSYLKGGTLSGVHLLGMSKPSTKGEN
jgi:hypothetical protein